jgi:hypothetical protein
MRYLEVALLVALVALLAVQVQRGRCCLLAVAAVVAAVDTAQVVLVRLVALEPFPVVAVAEVGAGLQQGALAALAVMVKLLL